MLQKSLLLSLLFLLSGCSLESMLAQAEVDKVYIVKQNASLSHYRAYFKRSQLQPIIKGKKYLYFYNQKKKDLAILLHRYNKYYLYSIYHPASDVLIITSNKKTNYKKIKKYLYKKGYVPTSLSPIYATSKVGLRRYKGIKTLLVEIKDYRALHAKYKHAIKTYNARGIKRVSTKLPKRFITSYYEDVYQKASSPAQRKQLNIIAKKLGLHKNETKAQENDNKELEVFENNIPNDRLNAFNYYNTEASYDELDNYLSKSKMHDTLSFNQTRQLKKRHAQLKENKILHEKSLDELIALYKANKNPKYKERIVYLMKEGGK